MSRTICVIMACFMVIMLFSGCTALQKLGMQKNGDDELQPASSVVMSEDEAKKLTDKVPIHLYFATEDNSKLKLEVRYIPVSEAKKSVNNLASVIVKELIKGPGADSRLKPTIPAGTQLRSPVSVNAGIATVDLSKEFVDKHPGGKVAEQLTIYSIVNSLTELKDIQKVKFLINGKVTKDFKGNFQFDMPFPRSPSLISKDTAAPAKVNPEAQKEQKGQETDKNKQPGTADQQDNKKEPDNINDRTKDDSQGGEGQETVSPNVLDEEDEATYLEVLE